MLFNELIGLCSIFMHLKNLSEAQAFNAYEGRKLADETLHKLLASENYNRDIRPASSEHSDSTLVTVFIHVGDIEYIDDHNMEYGLDLYLNQYWVDHRLQYTFPENINVSVGYLTLEDKSKIWQPNLYFLNLVRGSLSQVLKPSQSIRIFPEGIIETSYRVSLRLACPMDLKLYPFDHPICSLVYLSYGLTETELETKWSNDTPLAVEKDLYLARFVLKDYSTSKCKSVWSTVSYACLKAEFRLKRQISYYLVQMYVPCFMLVIISWISFWFDETAVDARITLGGTAILTTIFQVYCINHIAPTVPYIKALDIFTGVCEIFVVAALLEFAVVNYVRKSEWRALTKKEETNVELFQQEFLTISNKCPRKNIWSFINRQNKNKSVNTARRIDLCARVVFPLSFLVFNILYWYVCVFYFD